jgi:hypothetical protein
MELKSPEKEVEYKATFNDSGKVILKKKSKIKKGKKSRSSGGQFESRVRKDLEEKGWIVDKWTNNANLEEKKIHPAKRKFNPFSKVMTIGTGFPDFLCFQKMDKNYQIIGVEVKMNGTLSKTEKDKCNWYLENNVFSEILIAKKIKKKNRVGIEYINVQEILKRMRS